MTCFRMENGESVYSYCMKNKIHYGSFYIRMERGMPFDDALTEAKKVTGQKFSHPKYFFKGRSLADICGGYTKIYHRVIRRIRSGSTIGDALARECII